MYCSSGHSFAFYVGKVALLYFSSGILQMSPGLTAKDQVQECVWINTHLFLPLGWGCYTHLLYENSTLLSYWNVSAWLADLMAPPNSRSGTFHWLLPHVPQLQFQTLNCRSWDIHQGFLYFHTSLLGHALRLSEACFIPSNLGPFSHLLCSPACPITSPVVTNSSLESYFQWRPP